MSVKKGIVYIFIANIINLIMNLVSGFVLPKYLSIESYAQIKVFQLYITYIGIAHLGFADGMNLRHGGKDIIKIDKNEVLEEFKTFKYFQICISAIAIMVSLIIKNEILFFCSLVILPINIANYMKNLYTAIGKFKKYSQYTNLNTVFIFIINIILLFIIKTDSYYVYIIAYIFIYFLYGIFINSEAKKIFGKDKVKFNKKYIVEDIKLGFLLLIGNFCNVIFTSIDRLFIKNFIGIIKFAYYSFATNIESLMNVFISPISIVMYNYFCKTNGREDVLNVKRYILLFASIIIILIFPVKFLIQNWLIKYYDSLVVLFILIGAQYISIIIRTVHINIYKAKKEQKKFFKVMGFIVILSAILDFIAFSISKSMVYIAYATLITNVVWFIIGEFDLKEYKLSIKDYIYIFIILILFLICGNIINNAIIGFVVYISIMLIFIFILERKTFGNFIQIIIKIAKEKFKRKRC